MDWVGPLYGGTARSLCALAWLLALLLFPACADPTVQRSRLDLAQFLALRHPTLRDLVRAMETSSQVERREILRAILDHRAIAYHTHTYTARGAPGENFIFENGEGKPTVIFTAHYDVAPHSPGANDDASCIASILAAYDRLRRDPPRALKARFIIFDGEERTREGSQAYVTKRDLRDVIGVYSYELCGIGERTNIWDVVTPELKETLIFTALVEALEEAGAAYVVRGYVGHSSDHSSFMKLNPPIPGFAVTILPKGFFSQLKPFAYYHRPTDVASTLDEEAMQTMAEVIYRTVRKLEAKFR